MTRRAVIIALVLIASPVFVWAADIVVTAIVESTAPPTPADTVVIFRGLAYPGSPVTVKREGVVAVTVPADPAARFDVTLQNQTPGQVTYSVSSEDARGLVSQPMNFALTITSGTTSTLTGIFLGPTIEVDKTEAKIGETITMLGQTAPDSEVSIFVSSTATRTFKTNSDSSGLWSRQILAEDLGAGNHTARAKAVTAASEISAYSASVDFEVVAAPTPDKCDGKKQGDVNCDGRVNLTDFSILLYYWRQTNPKNARADVNGDHTVNLTDVSIMLFNWDRT